MDSSPVQHNTREQMPQTIEDRQTPVFWIDLWYILIHFVILILIIIHRKPHFRATYGEFVCRAYIKYCTIFFCNKQMK